MNANVRAIEKAKHPNSDDIAKFLESLAADLRAGKVDLSALHIIEVEPDGHWRERAIGDIHESTLIGYLMRAVHGRMHRMDYNG